MTDAPVTEEAAGTEAAAAAAEPQTHEEWQAALEAELAGIRRQRKLVALVAYRLRGSAHFCESGLANFYHEVGIPYDQYYSKRYAQVKDWDGELDTTSSRSHRSERWKSQFLLLESVDASLYSEAGLKIILERVREQHGIWLDEVRRQAMTAQQRGHFGTQALFNALEKAGIEPPKTVTSVRVQAGAQWSVTMAKKDFDRATFERGLKKAVAGYIAEHGGEGLEYFTEPVVSVSTTESVR